MSEGSEKKPKIIVDEDWKSQVQAEKESAQQRRGGDEPDEQQPADDAGGQAPPEIPPASFSLLATTLAAQAMTSLGLTPDPIEGKPVVRLDLARHYIDTLGILEEKTQGNLTPDESNLLGQILHEVRMAFIASQGAPQPPAKE